MNTQAAQSYTFDSFRLDPRERLLSCEGKPVPLSPKALELLVLLVANAGHLVEKDDLIRHLWPDSFVEEGSLLKHIYLLRKALGQGRNGTEYIETVPKHGYRFVAEVSSAMDTASAAGVLPYSGRSPEAGLWKPWALSSSARLALFAIVALAFGLGAWYWFSRTGAASVRSVAVLPLENLSSDPAQEYFADGMTDELITDLAKIGGLRVVSRTSVMQYKGARKPLRQIGRELNVDAVVEGTVLRSGNQVRITAQLIQATTDRHLWAESYEGNARDVLKLQNEVASAIVNQVSIKLTPQEQALLSSSRPVNLEAHEAYLKGRFLWHERTTQGLQKAIEYFNEAIRKDPNYAFAYAGLADCYAVLSDHDALPPGDTYPKAKMAALKALEIEDTLAEPHAVLARFELGYDWDAPRAEREFRRAIGLDPNYATAHQWYSVLLYEEGRFDDAIREAKRALELDPLNVTIDSNLGSVYYYARRYDEAIEQQRKALDLHPSAPGPHQDLVIAYLAKGMHAEFIDEARRWLMFSGEESRAHAAGVLARLHAADYRQALRVLISQAIAERRLGYSSAVWISALYARRGDEDHAIEWLEQAYMDRDDNLPSMKVEPAFDQLHSNPRFQDLLRRTGLRTSATAH
jgi:TolB-like protein/DNA-binding winged helix-turn-helix (wHTH) protein/Tfp pilus assembly protein PilF